MLASVCPVPLCVVTMPWLLRPTKQLSVLPAASGGRQLLQSESRGRGWGCQAGPSLLVSRGDYVPHEGTASADGDHVGIGTREI